MTQLTIAVLIVLGTLTLLDWRKGLPLCVVLGIAQDPLRKLAPGQPVYYVVLVGALFGLAWIRASLVGVALGPSVIYGWKRHLRMPFMLFMMLVVLQALQTYIRYGSLLMPGIGLLVWLAPIPAVLLGYQFALRQGAEAVRRWMSIYALVALASLSGVYFEYQGFSWPVLGEIGAGQLIYDVGTVLKAHSGFFRASEIAAWHAATIACFVFTLAIGKRATALRVAGALAMVAVLVSLGILTGRRKMLVEITVFLSCYFFLVAWLQRGMARLAMCLLLMGAVGYVAIVGFMAPDLVQRPVTTDISIENAQRMEGYAARGQTVFADMPDRFRALGVLPVARAVDLYGLLGAGLGTASQGTTDIAAENNIDRNVGEGGLGKITMELGLPGLFLIGWMAIALTRHLYQQLAVVARLSRPHARLAFGFVAFLIANAATFTVATQAYSDLFILLIIGWSVGFLLAIPPLAAAGDTARRGRVRSTVPPTPVRVDPGQWSPTVPAQGRNP